MFWMVCKKPMRRTILTATFNTNATIGTMFLQGYFGRTAKGGFALGIWQEKTYRFYDDKENQKSYNDAGKAIVARWDIPDLSGKAFYRNKTFRYLSLRLLLRLQQGLR